jgi:hypothetical protein
MASVGKATSVEHAKKLVFSEENVNNLVAVIQDMYPDIIVPKDVVVMVLIRIWRWSEIEFRQHSIQGIADPVETMAENVTIKAGTVLSEKAQSQVRGDNLWKEFVGNGFRPKQTMPPKPVMAPCARTEERQRGDTSMISITSNVCKDDINDLVETRLSTLLRPAAPAYGEDQMYPQEYR